MIYVTTAGRLRDFPSGARWLYLGGNVTQLAKAEDHFGPERRIALGRGFAKIVDEIRDAVNDAVAMVGEAQPDLVSWWATDLAHRPRGGNVLLLAGFIKAFRDVVVDRLPDESGATVVIVEDPWCFAAIREAVGGDPRIKFTDHAAGWLRLRVAAASLFRGVLVRAFAVGLALIEKAYFGVLNRGPLHSAATAEGTIWNFAFVEARLFTHGGGLEDPYLPRIRELVGDAGGTLRRFTNLLFPVRFYRLVARNHDTLEVMIRHVRLWDIFRAALQVPRFRAPASLTAGSVPLAWLIRRERWREFRSKRLMTESLWYAACNRFLKQPAVASSSVFFWWENQPWNKLLCLARDGHQGRRPRLVGYQHCALSANQLNFFPSKLEVASVPIPDVIFTNSPSARDLLLRAGFPAERLEMAGNMRLSYEEHPPPSRENEPFTVSVYLPCDLLVAREMMVALVKNGEVWCRNGVRFFLHPHPDVPFSLIGLGPGDGESLEAGLHSVRECASKVDVMLCSNTVVSLEGLALGIPVISYIPERALWMDAAADSYPGYVTSCSSDDLMESVLRAKDRKLTAREPPESWRHAAEIFPPWDRSCWLEKGIAAFGHGRTLEAVQASNG